MFQKEILSGFFLFKISLFEYLRIPPRVPLQVSLGVPFWISYGFTSKYPGVSTEISPRVPSKSSTWDLARDLKHQNRSKQDKVFRGEFLPEPRLFRRICDIGPVHRCRLEVSASGSYPFVIKSELAGCTNINLRHWTGLSLVLLIGTMLWNWFFLTELTVLTT